MSQCSLARSERTPDGRRAQSNPIGVVLVFGLVMVGGTIVLVFGAAALDQTGQQLTEERTENVLTQLDSEAALVALGQTEMQSIALPQRSGGQFQVHNDSGRLTVRVTNQTTGLSRALVETDLGAVVFDGAQTEIAYQGGGVWRKSGEGSVMVSPPEFHYRNATLTLPLVTVSGDASLSSRAHLSKNGTTTRVFPQPASPTRSNPLEQSKINVTVQSAYYEAWGTYFETRTAGDVAYDHDDSEATVTLVVPAENPPVDAGVVAGAPGTTVSVDQTADVDSYNSSTGPYAGFPDGNDTKLIAAGDVDVLNNAELYGSVEVAGWVNVSNNGIITGNAQYGLDIDVANNGEVQGWQAQNATVDPPDSVDNLINGTVETIRTDNDNGPAPAIDDATNTLTGCSGTCTLTAGVYYLEAANIGSGERLRLDTSGGGITLAVNGSLDVADGGTIYATDDNRTNVYVTGNAAIGGESGRIEPNVNVENDRTPKLWVYMRSDRAIHFAQHAKFQGVVYGPGRGTNPGVAISYNNQAQIWGGLVGDVPILENQLILHYDEALKHSDSVQEFYDIPALTYLHVTVDRVEISS